MGPETRANLSPPVFHLEAVPSPPTPLPRSRRAQGSLQLVPDGADPRRARAHGPFLSVLAPCSGEGSHGSALSPVADGLQLHWDGTERGTLKLVPPGHQGDPAAGRWVLLVPLEPLLLQATAEGRLQDLVIDRPEALVAGEAQENLSAMAAALIDSAAPGLTTEWLQREAQLIGLLTRCLQRPDLAGAQRRDRGWRHLCMSLTWMAEHLADDFNLADVASVAGITPRALQMAYRRHLDKRPLQSLRLLRLAELRRRLLQSPSPSRRLTEHLDHCGLSRSGSTARHYRERYGEKPSQTRP